MQLHVAPNTYKCKWMLLCTILFVIIMLHQRTSESEAALEAATRNASAKAQPELKNKGIQCDLVFFIVWVTELKRRKQELRFLGEGRLFDLQTRFFHAAP